MFEVISAVLGVIILILIVIIIKLKSENKSLDNKNESEELEEVKRLYTSLKSNYKKLLEKNEFLEGTQNDFTRKIKDLEQANIELLERKEALQRSKEKLEAIHKQKEELFAIAIHDIKNPVSAIKGYLDLLESFDLTALEQQEIITGLLASSDRIVNLANDLTLVIASDSNEEEYEFRPTSISEILHSVYLQNGAYAESKKIKLINQSSSNLPKVNIDADKIEEVVDNLVNNAIKYNHPNTIVLIKSFFNSSNITIEISDNGVGLDEKEVKLVFKKGQLLSPTPTGNETRSGLGLWIVKKIIEDHNGEVFVKSKKGTGATFSFTLPIIKEST